MATYHYTAEDSEGRRLTGQIEASDADAARGLLGQRNLRVLEVVAAGDLPPSPAAGVRLSAAEAGQVVEQVAQLSNARLPLAAGLRAAAEECDNSRQAKALDWLADQIEQGRSLEEALMSSSELLPRHVNRLIAAAARTGQLGMALSELAEHERAAASLRRGILGGLAYPLLVACLAGAVFLFLITFVAGAWEKLFQDFGMELPLLTKVFFWWHHIGLWLFTALLVVLVIVAVGVRRRLGLAGWQGLLASLPAVGPLWYWSGLVEWSSLLVVLVRHQVPLPEALRLAGDGVSSAHIGRVSLALAEGVSRGRNLSDLIAAHRQMPTSLAPLVRWGEKLGNLAESLATGREILEERVRMRSFWLQTILPPALFIGIGCGVCLVIGALFLPLISLLSRLS